MKYLLSFIFSILLVCKISTGSDWTVIPVGNHICVSSTGNDISGNGSEITPYKTVTKAVSVMQAGTDIWLDSGTWPGITGWSLSGTTTNPCVIMTWPGRVRAVISSTGPAFSININSPVNNVWLIDLELRNSGSDYPLDLLGSGNGFRIEGCVITGGNGVRIQGWPADSNRWANMTWFRTTVINCPNLNGIFAGSTDNLRFIESNVIHCGPTGAAGNLRKQGLYIHESGTSATVSGSIFAYPSAGGLQLRVGGSCDDSFATSCGVAFQIGHAEAPYRAIGSITNCVVFNGANIGPDPRGFAYWIDNTGDIILNGNMVINNINGSQPVAISLRNGSRASISNCLVYKWTNPGENVIEIFTPSSYTLAGNNDFNYAFANQTAPVGTYPDPTRTVAKYSQSIGLANNEDALWTAISHNSKINWDSRLTAHAINEWFRGGFYAIQNCAADLTGDNAVTIDDLQIFLISFENGTNNADLDNGSGNGVHDGSIDINDLLLFLRHFEAGC